MIWYMKMKAVPGKKRGGISTKGTKRLLEAGEALEGIWLLIAKTERHDKDGGYLKGDGSV